MENQGNQYESDTIAAQYCYAHYGPDLFGVANFPLTCARMCLDLTEGRNRGRALDLGCAVGRASFELARRFERVTGMDFSIRFIESATRIKTEGVLPYLMTEEGEIMSRNLASLEELGLDGCRENVAFSRADACDLPEQCNGYDLVLAANLIDRLHSPRRFLAGIGRMINPGGLLVITSPYTWMEEFTSREEWLGGYLENGAEVTTLDGLAASLSSRFRMLCPPRDIPFVIRETRRKFQHSIAEMTVWERKETA